jgi:hypothetical protein
VRRIFRSLAEEFASETAGDVPERLPGKFSVRDAAVVAREPDFADGIFGLAPLTRALMRIEQREVVCAPDALAELRH